MDPSRSFNTDSSDDLFGLLKFGEQKKLWSFTNNIYTLLPTLFHTNLLSQHPQLNKTKPLH